MTQHIQGAVQFVSNNYLKFDGPSEAIPALPDPAKHQSAAPDGRTSNDCSRQIGQRQ